MKQIKFKFKSKKSLVKRIKISGTGKIIRSHQLRTGHLRRHKSKRALRRHARPLILSKSDTKAVKRMLGV
jgi:large subunit ribosomal protein L35